MRSVWQEEQGSGAEGFTQGLMAGVQVTAEVREEEEEKDNGEDADT